MTAPTLLECDRCGFRVNLDGASDAGRTRLSALHAEHVARCAGALPLTVSRRIARAVRSERFLRGQDAAERLELTMRKEAGA